MPLFAVCVRRPTGNYARRDFDGTHECATLEEFQEKVKLLTSNLTRFGDVWNIVYVPTDDKLPCTVVYTPVCYQCADCGFRDHKRAIPTDKYANHPHCPGCGKNSFRPI